MASSSVKFSVTAVGIGSILAAIPGVLGLLKGEPDAALAYQELAKQINQIQLEVEKEHAYVQGFLQGLQKNQDTKKELKEKPRIKKPKVIRSKVVKPKATKPKIKKSRAGGQKAMLKLFPMEKPRSNQSIFLDKIKKTRSVIQQKQLPPTLEQLKTKAK